MLSTTMSGDTCTGLPTMVDMSLSATMGAVLGLGSCDRRTDGAQEQEAGADDRQQKSIPHGGHYGSCAATTAWVSVVAMPSASGVSITPIANASVPCWLISTPMRSGARLRSRTVAQ
jgi:hypothetical protein